jgi:nucleotide sugar dehydrogenase
VGGSDRIVGASNGFQMQEAAMGHLDERLVRAIDDGTAVVAVIGQGYVGLSVAAGAALRGLPVKAFDIDADRIAALADGRNVVPGVPTSVFDEAHASDRMTFTTDPRVVAEADVVVICVPTPVTEHRPDLRFIEAAGRLVGEHLRAGSLVILESTTYAGTTEEVLEPLLTASGLRQGIDFLLAYSPERIDPGNPKYGMTNTPRVVGGVTPGATRAAGAFYSRIVDDVTHLSSARAAEMAKLLENTFRMVNIALVNELATLCAEQDLDVWEVIRAAATKPFGYMPFYPGPGVGGHCIPLDPTYLAWQSRRDVGRPFRLVETAQDINADMPRYVTRRVVDTLGDHGIAIRGARLLALGVTYKPDVGDLRESAAIEVVARLLRRGADVSFHDPFVQRLDEHGLDLESVPLTGEALGGADMVLLLTPHSDFDMREVVARSRLLFDARGATTASSVPPSVVRL